MQNHLSFHYILHHERERHGWSQEELAEKVGVDTKTVRRWESGKTTPRSYARRKLCEVLKMSIEELRLTVDEDVLETAPQQDWGEAPRVSNISGRSSERDCLLHWLQDDSCHVIAIVGVGGVGKTTLASLVAEHAGIVYPYLFWRSLHNAPPLQQLLKSCICFLSHQQESALPEGEDDLIGLLQHYLQSHHCLLVLDNFESILQPQQRAGQYQKGYEGYGRLIQRLGETQHSSCLLLTSRDKPREVAQQEGLLAPVRSYSLHGVDVVEGQAILREKGLSGSEDEWVELLRLYAGNPLALKLVAEPIREVFGGSLSRFLAGGSIAFGDLNDVLAQQIQRLSSQETDIVCWLAIEREAVLLEELRDDLLQRMHKHELVSALASLRRRSLVESEDAITFTLQPVIMEYMITHLVQRLCAEFQAEVSNVWTHYALLKAQAKDYVRESQRRVLLEPVAQQLLDTYGQAGLKQQIQEQLAFQRHHHSSESSYRAGNILNLLIFLNYELRDFDFSHLMIRQAYLQNASLAEVNFASAHFVDPVFTNTFGNMLAVAFNHDGKLLIAGTATGDIWVYDIVHERQQALFSGHTDAVWSIALSPDQHLLASGSDDGTVRLWDMHTSECLAIFGSDEARTRAVAFHGEGKILMSGSDDGKIRLWNVVTGQCLTTLEGHTDRVWAVALCPTGDILATGSTDMTIRLWNITTGECIAVMEGHTNSIRALAFHPDGDVLASASDDETVRLWSRASTTEIRVLSGHTNRVWSVAFSMDGQKLASGSEDRTIRVWETTTGRCLQTLHGHAHGVRSVTFGAHDMLASGGDDQTARLWNINTGYCLRTFHGYTNRIWSTLFCPDGQQLLSSSEDSSIRVWDVQTAQCIRTIEDRTHVVRCLAYSPDGRSCASGGEDQTVHIWDLATGHVSKTLRGHSNWVRAVAFHPSGHMIASGGEDYTVRLWDRHSGFCLHRMSGHTSWVRAVAFSPDGTVLATCGDDALIRLWDPATGTFVRTVEGHEGRIRTLAFHPQGQLLASGSEDHTVRLWDIGTGQCRTILRRHTGRIRSVAFSPNGLLLASSGDDQIIHIWNMQSEQSVAVFQTHTRVRWLSFHPNGELLASNGDDGFIRLWHLPTGQCVQTFLLKRPYEGVNITAVRGLTSAQKATLCLLGAVENT